MTDQVIVFGSFSLQEAEKFQRIGLEGLGSWRPRGPPSSARSAAANHGTQSGLTSGGPEIGASSASAVPGPPSLQATTSAVPEAPTAKGVASGAARPGPQTNGNAVPRSSPQVWSGTGVPEIPVLLPTPAKEPSPPLHTHKLKPPSPPTRTLPPHTAPVSSTWVPKAQSLELTAPPQRSSQPISVTQTPPTHVSPPPTHVSGWGGKPFLPDLASRPPALPHPPSHSPSSSFSGSPALLSPRAEAWGGVKSKSPAATAVATTTPPSPRGGAAAKPKSPDFRASAMSASPATSASPPGSGAVSPLLPPAWAEAAKRQLAVAAVPAGNPGLQQQQQPPPVHAAPATSASPPGSSGVLPPPWAEAAKRQLAATAAPAGSPGLHQQQPPSGHVIASPSPPNGATSPSTLAASAPVIADVAASAVADVAAPCQVAVPLSSAAPATEATKPASVGEAGRLPDSASPATVAPAQQQQAPRQAPKSWAALVGVQMQWEQVPKSLLNPPGKVRGTYVPPPPRPTLGTPASKAKAPTTCQLSIPGSGATPANPPLSGPAWIEVLQESESGRNARLQPRGLLNTGNSCFLNSTLQALLSLPPFLQLLLSLRSWKLPATCPTLRAFSQFVSEFELLPPAEAASASAPEPEADLGVILDLGRPFAPDFVDVLERFSPGQQPRGTGCRTRQEDAQEFLSFVMDRMHEELLELENRSAPNGDTGTIAVNGGAPGVSSPASDDGDEWETVGPKNRTAVTRTHSLAESALSDIFGGQLCSVIRTKGSKPSATVQPFLLLQLDILPEAVHSVQDALQHYTVPEQLDGYKGKHGKADTAYKQVKFQSLPRVLVLHLMRFSFGATGTGKVHKPVTFPLTLELGRDLVASSSEVKNNYELVATVSHHGKDPSGGHYTADTKQPDKRWLRFDDGIVTVVPVKNVLQSQAYLLLYKRIV